MTRILAAIDGGPPSASVVDVARNLAGLFHADVDVVTVVDASHPNAPELDQTLAALDARRIAGPTVETILDLADDADVVAVVVGSRGVRGGARPAGHVTTALLTNLSVPVVAVPPGLTDHRGLEVAVVPIEGGRPLSTRLTAILDRWTDAGRRVIPMHVFDLGQTPAFWDGWHDRELYGQEFGLRYGPASGDPVVLRAGDAGSRVLAVLADTNADLAIVEWKQRLNTNHGAVVRALLTDAPVSVLLIPEGRNSGDEDTETTDGRDGINGKEAVR